MGENAIFGARILADDALSAKTMRSMRIVRGERSASAQRPCRAPTGSLLRGQDQFVEKRAQNEELTWEKTRFSGRILAKTDEGEIGPQIAAFCAHK